MTRRPFYVVFGASFLLSIVALAMDPVAKPPLVPLPVLDDFSDDSYVNFLMAEAKKKSWPPDKNDMLEDIVTELLSKDYKDRVELLLNDDLPEAGTLMCLEESLELHEEDIKNALDTLQDFLIEMRPGQKEAVPLYILIPDQKMLDELKALRTRKRIYSLEKPVAKRTCVFPKKERLILHKSPALERNKAVADQPALLQILVVRLF